MESENLTPDIEENGGAEPTPQNGQENTGDGDKTPKTYTAEELQAETEKRVNEALKTANAKSEAAFKKQLEDAKAQWEKEAKMTAAEREKAAQDKARAEFENEKAVFAHEKLVSRAQGQLIKSGLPEDIAELITASDATEEKIGEGRLMRIICPAQRTKVATHCRVRYRLRRQTAAEILHLTPITARMRLTYILKSPDTR